jgi:hypothetical protein
MPYHDIKILNVKDMEIKGHDDIMMMYVVLSKIPHSFRLERGPILRYLFVGARGSLPK